MPMADRKVRKLIDQLVVGGKVNADVQMQLEKTRARIDDLLIETVTRHRDDLMREVCASILGERRSACARIG
jgi:polyhydroxyalkanoate synthesis regulator phasin